MLKSDDQTVLRMSWLPRMPFSYWSESGGCNQPVGILVDLVEQVVKAHNKQCREQLVVEWQCVTDNNGTYINAINTVLDGYDMLAAVTEYDSTSVGAYFFRG